MSENDFDKGYLALTMNVLKDMVDDLCEWSVYNKDKGLDDIHELKEQVAKLEEKLEQ